MEWRYLVWEVTHEAILKASSEAHRTVSELKIALEKIIKGQFSAGPINKAVLSFTSSLRRVRER